jgi:6-phosphogluconolactonase
VSITVYVGCYTTPDRAGRGEGISAFRMDEHSGAWTPLGLAARTANPSFLISHPTRPVVYCVHGGMMSEVSAFAIEGEGRLAPLGSRPSGGVNPVHLNLHPSGRWLVVANYTGANIAMLPVSESGALDDPCDIVPLHGTPGPDPKEQSSPHPHDIPLDPSGEFVAVPDKGLDCVFVFRVDAQTGRFRPAAPPSVESAPGAGPRHIAFHPRERWAYVINELNSTVTTYAFDQGGDGMRYLQTIPSIPRDLGMRNTGAEVVVHPSGKWVYVSNRGQNSVGAFSVDERAGTLTPLDWSPTDGDTPRAIALSPDGRFLYAANQMSDTIITFRVDERAGTLTPTGQVIATGSPSTLLFTGERE